MKYLIDTHIFIYIVEGDKSKFSNNQLNILQNTNNEFYLSSISLWELAIKFRIGKIHLKYDFNDYLSVKRRTAKIKILPIKLNYIQKISTLITAI
ncbi:MAG: PIN domain-containing protein, partial [Cytophagia bacterium]